MPKAILIGILVVVIVAIGGYFVLSSGPTEEDAGVATSGDNVEPENIVQDIKEPLQEEDDSQPEIQPEIQSEPSPGASLNPIPESPPPPAPEGPSVEELQGTWKLEKELNLNFTTGQFEEQASITCERNCHFLFKGNGVCFKDTPPPQGLPFLNGVLC